uniref:Nucleoporin GLE1 n=1 Tax=Caenorhabditis tropicalis TaxID=1561998 RepID=A0A1I7TSW7_9PELO
MSYRQDCENAANERKENMAREEESRKNTLILLTQQQESNMARLRELRTQEAERDLAENQRHDANMQQIDVNNRAAYEKISADRDQKLKQLAEDEIKNCERFNEFLQKQKESLSCDLKDLSERQLDKLKEKESEMNKKAEEFATKAENLKKERLVIQSNYDEDLEKYQKKYFETKERHGKETDELLDQQQNLQIEQEKDAEEAELKLTAYFGRLSEYRETVASAGIADVTELDLIDAVELARRQGSEALSAVMELGDNAYRLKNGKDQRVVNALETALARNVNPKLVVLHRALVAIRDQQENKNEKVVECQAAASNIIESLVYLVDSLSEFRSSLKDDPIDNSVELYKKVVKNLKDLVQEQGKLPSIPPTRHRINAITANTTEVVKSITDRVQRS